MKSDPVITVSCDAEGCSDSIQCGLTVTSHGYDERYLDNEIENQGWTIKDDKQFCPEHSEEE
jgi:hypothetical protein